jgi:F-type H+-transporting ATPase subunit epsilon
MIGHHSEATNLHVIARSPFNVYFEGAAQVVSASNRVGNFDILPGHADFFSVLDPGQVIVEPGNGDPVNFDITNGIITVRNNEVMLFVNM